mmetsp:Transcript_12188/g.29765  ORF Transcript_12188/g.29765 Transcript_12188/m.29765 type:complete len:274 (-) Transcript_12188:1406-2227(-)
MVHDAWHRSGYHPCYPSLDDQGDGADRHCPYHPSLLSRDACRCLCRVLPGNCLHHRLCVRLQVWSYSLGAYRPRHGVACLHCHPGHPRSVDHGDFRPILCLLLFPRPEDQSWGGEDDYEVHLPLYTRWGTSLDSYHHLLLPQGWDVSRDASPHLRRVVSPLLRGACPHHVGCCSSRDGDARSSSGDDGDCSSLRDVRQSGDCCGGGDDHQDRLRLSCGGDDLLRLHGRAYPCCSWNHDGFCFRLGDGTCSRGGGGVPFRCLRGDSQGGSLVGD